MKRIAGAVLEATVLVCIASACSGSAGEAVEKMIPASNVEVVGPDASLVQIAGDTKVFMVQNPANKNKWTIQALVPIKNTMELPGLEEIPVSGLDILDANYSQLHEKFGMHLQNDAMVVALFGSQAGTVKNVVFEPVWKTIAFFDQKQVADLVNRTENIVLNLKVRDGAVAAVPGSSMVYSCGFDGYVNMRQSPSFSAAKVGVFNNGPVGAALLEDLGDWKKIDYAGQVGYVHTNYLQSTPTEAYSGGVSGDWVSGAWSNGGSFLYLYNNGTWVQGSGSSPVSYGLFYMQNNEVKLVPIFGSFSQILPINQSQNKLGDYGKIASAGDLYKTYRLDFNKVVAQQRTNGAYNLLVDAANRISEGVSSSSSSSGSVSSGNSVDKWLDEYERYVNQYVSYIKKAKNGDSSAIAEYVKLLQKCESVYSKYGDFEDEMTVEHLNRLNRIHEKMIRAMD